MMLTLAGLGAVSLLELCLWLPFLWRGRKALAWLLMVLVMAATAGLLYERLATWTVLLAGLSLYRCLNLARVGTGRAHPGYLYHASRRTSLWLIASQLAIVGAAAVGYHFSVEPIIWWDILASLQLVCAVVLLASTLRHLDTTRPPELEQGGPLPTLSVMIPARNETDDLEACLRSLAASTYPKLEILVLDDCSQNKRTPEIIRGFAHDGVQFIPGKVPPERWLAKNYAYQQLAEAANGEILLFCGVDTRFEPETLTVLVRTLLQKQKTMLSILPRNLASKSWNPVSWFIQPSRYAWELALPRRLVQRPPVLSTCWLITRETLKMAGGFEAVQRKIVPESYFAKAAASRGDGYSFLCSDERIGLASAKSPEEQKATAIRTRYPQLHRRPELAAFVAFGELAVLVWPLIMLVACLLSGLWLLAAVSGLAFLMSTVTYDKIVNLTYRGFTLKGMWLLPLAALYDIGLLNYSMWRYEFDEVLWKGRNVCIPVMQAIPGLPKLP
jgi:chlorobactene glucosyltransferase